MHYDRSVPFAKSRSATPGDAYHWSDCMPDHPNEPSQPNANEKWWDISKVARAAQIEYGRWIVNTLWLMHSGAIAGLLTKWDGRGAFPHRLSLVCFALGIVFAFGTAAAAWLNFSVSEDHFKRLTDAGEKWRELSLDTHSKWMRWTTYFAIASVASSIVCLIVGAVIAIL